MIGQINISRPCHKQLVVSSALSARKWALNNQAVNLTSNHHALFSYKYGSPGACSELIRKDDEELVEVLQS